MEEVPEKRLLNKPPDSDFYQLRYKTYPAEISTFHWAIIVIILGIIFLPTGTDILSTSDSVYENKITYDDGDYSNCSITNNNEGRLCQLTFEFTEDVSGPVYVYYQLEHYFQNHRRYYESRSIQQLQGNNLDENEVELDCSPLYKNGSLLLNPCGLIANSFFNDVFELNTYESTNGNLVFDSSNIAIYSDENTLYKQVSGFQYVIVDDTSVSCSSVNLPDTCKSYTDPSTGTSYLFNYPDDDTTQYLYEAYPDQISPIDGVTDQHFIVWMRPAMLPTFRKLYGQISGDFNSGDKLVFNVTANFEVQSFDATKSLLITNLGPSGSKNRFVGQAYVVAGSFSLAIGVFMLIKIYFFN